jgi:hypothetical protein
MFAEHYIKDHLVYPALIKNEILPDSSIIVVIPCLNEPQIIQTLESVWACHPIGPAVEVIVLINDSEQSSDSVKQFNLSTYSNLVKWKNKYDSKKLIVHPVHVSINEKFAGAGMARKIGMDEAIRRFNFLNRPDGVIVSLDADCLVSANYLQRIDEVFQDQSCFASTINFRHQSGAVNPKQQEGICLYEEYLHYYKRALEFTGFPNSIYTIGSAFAVRANAYTKQGGMNRRKAGEDFYFLYKLTHLGNIIHIEDAYVFPSARISDRVPFGTGAAMTKWMNGTEDLNLSYPFKAFADLQLFFSYTDEFYKTNALGFNALFKQLPIAIQEFLKAINFEQKLIEIKQNSANLVSFTKRFFQVFDAFQVLKFLNFAQQNFYPQQKLKDAIAELNTAQNSF